MITDKDITKLKRTFATKTDLNGLEKRFTELVTSFKDAILKEILDMRSDNAILTGYKDQIEDHDIRIERLEKHTKVTPLLD